MPKRTNDFQTLITLIEMQLASIGASVTQSKTFRDQKTNEEREVDIAIESKISHHAVTLGIECRDHRRKADVTWIDQLIGKYENLPVNKVIAVSRSGFTKTAVVKAAKNNIDTLTLEEGIEADWLQFVNRLRNIKIESFVMPYLTELIVHIPPGSSPEDLKQINPQEASLHGPTGSREWKLIELVERYLSDPNLLKAVRESAHEVPPSLSGSTLIRFNVPLKPGCYVVGPKGEQHAVESLTIEARCRKEVSLVNLEHKSYKDAQVAIGVGESLGRRVSLAFVEEPEEGTTLCVEIRKLNSPH